MLKKEVMYSLRDISIIPSVITDIKSRSECNPYRPAINGGDKLMLPVITAPMSCVLNDENYLEFLDSGVNAIIPRTISLEKREQMMYSVFCAFSMSEVKYLLEKYGGQKLDRTMYILIDNANGHMRSHIELGKQLKRTFGDKVKVMGGNIANPNTYLSYEFAGFDYVRTGIGGGNCCFVGGTQISTINGNKAIEEIKTGDIVKTINGDRMVTNTIKHSTYSLITVNKEITCTPDHELFVIKQEDKEKVTEDNIKDVGFYIRADELIGNEDKYFLIGKILNPETIIPISSVTQESLVNPVEVFDLEVEDGHSYIANGYVVHNCITSTQTATHYSMASLISDICELRPKEYHCKLVADGGIGSYSDIIKCLALGADYVMCGKLFAKAALSGDSIGDSHLYYGMSTKMAQKEMGNSVLKTSEGRKETVIKEYTLPGWIENLHDYICSAMSYCDSRSLDEFREKAICRVLSPSASSLINDK